MRRSHKFDNYSQACLLWLQVVIFFVIGCVLAVPEPEAKPEAKGDAKPGILAPFVDPSVAYTSPLAYSPYVASPYVASPYVASYAAAYPVYSSYAAYSSPVVVV